jgi:hypothetical protein
VAWIGWAQALEEALADASDTGSVAFRFTSEVRGGHELILAADNEVQAVLNEFTDVSVSNAMRAALLTVITSNYFFTAAQAQLLLGTFDVGFEQTQVGGAALSLGASVAARAIACHIAVVLAGGGVGKRRLAVFGLDVFLRSKNSA